jgi:hypothetical protein
MKLFGLKDENGKEYVLTADNIKPLSNLSPLWDFKVEPIKPTPKFKVGDWIIISTTSTLCSTHGYGGQLKGFKKGQYPDLSKPFRIIDIKGIASQPDAHIAEQSDVPYIFSSSKDFRLATASEIEKHLIKEAEKKGFKDGVRYKDPFGQHISKLHFYKLYYWVDADMLSDGYGGAIYQQGEWATIIPDKKPLPKTKKELMDLLVHIAVHNSHQHVRETLDEYED